MLLCMETIFHFLLLEQKLIEVVFLVCLEGIMRIKQSSVLFYVANPHGLSCYRSSSSAGNLLNFLLKFIL